MDQPTKWFFVDEKNGNNILGPFSNEEMSVRYDMNEIKRTTMIRTEKDASFYTYDMVYSLCGKSPFMEKLTSITGMIQKKIASGQPVPEFLKNYVHSSKGPQDQMSNQELEKLKKKQHNLELDNLALKVQCKKVIMERDEARKKITAMEKELKDINEKKQAFESKSKKVDASTSKQAELASKINSLEQEVEKLTKEKVDAEKKMNTCVQILKSQVGSSNHMREELETTKKERDELKLKFEAAQKELDELKSQKSQQPSSSSTEIENQALKKQLEDHRKQVDLLEKAFKEKLKVMIAAKNTQELQTTKKQLDEETEKRQEVQKTVESLTEKVKELETKLESANKTAASTAELDAREKQLLELMRSIYKSEKDKELEEGEIPGNSEQSSLKKSLNVEAEIDKFFKNPYNDSDDSVLLVSNSPAKIVNTSETWRPPPPAPTTSPVVQILSLTQPAQIPLIPKPPPRHRPSPDISAISIEQEALPDPSKQAKRSMNASKSPEKRKMDSRSRKTQAEASGGSVASVASEYHDHGQRWQEGETKKKHEIIQYGDLMIDLTPNMRHYYEEICEALERGLLEPCRHYTLRCHAPNQTCRFSYNCKYLHYGEMTAGLEKAIDDLYTLNHEHVVHLPPNQNAQRYVPPSYHDFHQPDDRHGYESSMPSSAPNYGPQVYSKPSGNPRVQLFSDWPPPRQELKVKRRSRSRSPIHSLVNWRPSHEQHRSSRHTSGSRPRDRRSRSKSEDAGWRGMSAEKEIMKSSKNVDKERRDRSPHRREHREKHRRY